MSISIRKATSDDLDDIYMMGFDAWGEGLDQEEYLRSCRRSPKYKQGNWYVGCAKDHLIASLIVYEDIFHLPSQSFGIGSVATCPNYRKQGYGSQLVIEISRYLLNDKEGQYVFLHSDIDASFYERMGYSRIGDGSCMVKGKKGDQYNGVVPDYF